MSTVARRCSHQFGLVYLVSVDALALLNALANETRFTIIRMLHERDLCVCEFAEATGLAQSKLSYHLAVLRDAGLVTSHEDGRWNVYHLERRPLMRLGGLVQEALAEPYDLSGVANCRANAEANGACAPAARPMSGAAR